MAEIIEAAKDWQSSLNGTGANRGRQSFLELTACFQHLGRFLGLDLELRVSHPDLEEILLDLRELAQKGGREKEQRDAIKRPLIFDHSPWPLALDSASDAAREQPAVFVHVIQSLRTYAEQQGISPPECSISYAWGEDNHERWVERFATDLKAGGLLVVLDRWENSKPGKSLSRFVSRVGTCSFVIPVGTPLYLQKFENKLSSTGSVVAAEVDVISQRLLGTEVEKETVMPVLRAGDKRSSLPPLMRDRVLVDLRDDTEYFAKVFDLMLGLYGIPLDHPEFRNVRQSLRRPEAH